MNHTSPNQNFNSPPQQQQLGGFRPGPGNRFNNSTNSIPQQQFNNVGSPQQQQNLNQQQFNHVGIPQQQQFMQQQQNRSMQFNQKKPMQKPIIEDKKSKDKFSEFFKGNSGINIHFGKGKQSFKIGGKKNNNSIGVNPDFNDEDILVDSTDVYGFNDIPAIRHKDVLGTSTDSTPIIPTLLPTTNVTNMNNTEYRKYVTNQKKMAYTNINKSPIQQSPTSLPPRTMSLQSNNNNNNPHMMNGMNPYQRQMAMQQGHFNNNNNMSMATSPTSPTPDNRTMSLQNMQRSPFSPNNNNQRPILNEQRTLPLPNNNQRPNIGMHPSMQNIHSGQIINNNQPKRQSVPPQNIMDNEPVQQNNHQQFINTESVMTNDTTTTDDLHTPISKNPFMSSQSDVDVNDNEKPILIIHPPSNSPVKSPISNNINDDIKSTKSPSQIENVQDKQEKLLAKQQELLEQENLLKQQELDMKKDKIKQEKELLQQQLALNKKHMEELELENNNIKEVTENEISNTTTTTPLESNISSSSIQENDSKILQRTISNASNSTQIQRESDNINSNITENPKNLTNNIPEIKEEKIPTPTTTTSIENENLNTNINTETNKQNNSVRRSLGSTTLNHDNMHIVDEKRLDGIAENLNKSINDTITTKDDTRVLDESHNNNNNHLDIVHTNGDAEFSFENNVVSDYNDDNDNDEIDDIADNEEGTTAYVPSYANTKNIVQINKFKTITISSQQMDIISDNKSLINEVTILSSELGDSIRRETAMEDKLKTLLEEKDLEMTSDIKSSFEGELRKKSTKIVELIQQLNDERMKRFVAEEQLLLQENGVKPTSTDFVNEITRLKKELRAKDEVIENLTKNI